MPGKYVPPAINLTSFSCPHCGSLTTQFWHNLGADRTNKGETPYILTDEIVDRFKKSAKQREEDVPQAVWDRYAKIAKGIPLVRPQQEYRAFEVDNIFLSLCYNCDQLSIWLYNNLIWPSPTDAPEPNADLPDDIAADFREAGAILQASPRGAAALLRLCVQKLCKHLGEKGKNIDDDIASLVGKGLDPKVQRALDAVRVIGNEAVHPGTMDLKDDRATAEELFRLVNLITEVMVSYPKRVDEVYSMLPASKLKAIEERNARALPAPTGADDQSGSEGTGGTGSNGVG